MPTKILRKVIIVVLYRLTLLVGQLQPTAGLSSSRLYILRIGFICWLVNGVRVSLAHWFVSALYT
jgi:uncharacterized protein with PQ loop repeat